MKNSGSRALLRAGFRSGSKIVGDRAQLKGGRHKFKGLRQGLTNAFTSVWQAWKWLDFAVMMK